MHHLAVHSQFPKKHGGLGGLVVYLDTRGVFRPERIRAIVDGLSNDDRDLLASELEVAEKDLERAVLENIYVYDPINANEQILASKFILELARDLGDERPLSMLLVDSLMYKFRSEYQGRAELAERQQKVNKYLHDLTRIATVENMGLVATNSLNSSGEPYGRNIIGHSVLYGIHLKKTSGEKRIAAFEDTPNLVDSEVGFYVDEAGIREAE